VFVLELTHNMVSGVVGVVIVGAARTAIGSFGGALSSVPAPTLGAAAIKGKSACCRVSNPAAHPGGFNRGPPRGATLLVAFS
jgi:hypothetical protein